MGDFVKFPKTTEGKLDLPMILGVAIIAVLAVAAAKRAPALPVIGKLV